MSNAGNPLKIVEIWGSIWGCFCTSLGVPLASVTDGIRVLMILWAGAAAEEHPNSYMDYGQGAHVLVLCNRDHMAPHEARVCQPPSFPFLSPLLLSSTVEAAVYVTPSWAKEWMMSALVWRNPSLKEFLFELLFEFLHKGHSSLHRKQKNQSLWMYMRVLTWKQRLIFTTCFECQEIKLELWKLVS